MPHGTGRVSGFVGSALGSQAMALSQLEPLTKLTPEALRAATVAIEQAGEIATSAALLRHVTAAEDARLLAQWGLERR